ncbi:MAG TPA: translation elongation factor 4 [Patescibacteria group bacterium]
MSHIRNFSIIAHIDHGKTTLTDRLLRLTGTVSERELHERMMDSNPIEQERGITIKMAPVRMEYKGATLNLIDTPGHVDFGYEVSRSLAACEGVLLVIDTTQGVQAQTLSNYEKAKALGLKIIPVLNKIDLPAADVEGTMLECMETFGFNESDFALVSAKSGLGVEKLLDKIIEDIPPAPIANDRPLRALVMTSKYDTHKGVIAYVRVVEGTLDKHTKLRTMSGTASFTPVEVGFFNPQMQPMVRLSAGEVGYIATGLKDIHQVKVGDTLTLARASAEVQPLPGFKEPQPMVYMEVYPIEGDDYPLLQDAVDKLSLHDAALDFAGTHSQALGNGLRMGFLGILHAEIVLERLQREFNLDLIATAPSVPYEITLTDGQKQLIHSPAQMPDPSLIREIHEPITKTLIFAPEKYVGPLMKWIRERRGELLTVNPVGTRTKLEYRLPLAELITDFHDTLKSISSGFASMEYQVVGYEPVDAVKVTIMINKEEVEALSIIAPRDQAEMRGREIVTKLKEVVPRQLFEVPIQAAIGGAIIARETIKAYRKDVTAKLYGGDVTRRQKLLKKQAKGKKKMKQIGKVELNQDTFLAVLKR